MTKATKAALLSAFVFPGSGQFYLKRYWRGLLMILATLMGLTVIIVRTTLDALNALQVMQSSGKPIDANSVANLANSASSKISSDNTVVLIFIIACWIFSIIDAYRMGSKETANHGAETEEAE